MLPPSHQVKFTVGKCLRKHPALLSSSEFKKRHAAKFLQPYGSQTMLYQSLIKPGPRLVLLRSPPDTGKTSLAPSLPDLFPDQRTVRPLVIPPTGTLVPPPLLPGHHPLTCQRTVCRCPLSPPLPSHRNTASWLSNPPGLRPPGHTPYGPTHYGPILTVRHGSTHQVFCCLARRVNLEVAQTLYNMGIPFAWVHNNAITCSWLCGLRGASTSNSLAQMEEKLRLGVEKIQETSGGLGTGKVRKRRVP